MPSRFTRPLQPLLAATAALLLGCILSAAAWQHLDTRQRTRRHAEFEHLADLHLSALQHQFDHATERTRNLRQLWFAQGETMSAQSFARFVEHFAPLAQLQTYEWIPRLSQAERAQFEAAARAEGLRNFQIRDIRSNGPPEEAAVRPSYFPVRLVWPLAGNERALGIDLASEAVRRAALEQATRTAKASVTGPVHLVQDGKDSTALLIFVPCFSGGAQPLPAERSSALRGFALGVLRMPEFFARALAEVDPAALDIRARDALTPGPAGLLHTHWASARELNEPPEPEWFARSPLRTQRHIEFAGHPFELELVASPHLLHLTLPDSTPLWALAGGLCLSLLAALLLYVLLASKARVEYLVTQRTTELDTALARLQRSEHFHRTLIERLKTPMLTLDPASGLIENANLEAQHLLGLEGARLRGASLATLVGRPEADLLGELGEAWRGSRTCLHYSQVLTASGPREIDLYPSPLESEGRALLFAVMLDVTERRRVEAQLHLQSMAVEAAPSAIMITDLRGRIERVNAAFTALTGYSAEQAVGRRPGELLNAGQDLRDFHSRMWQTILAGKVWHGELRNRRRDGSLYEEEQTVAPVIDDQGRITHFVAIKIDVSARKQAEEALRAAKLAAEAASLAKSRFLASMSHEIRTPLNGILGMAQVLLQPGQSPGEQQHYARTILEAGQTLLALLNDILDLSKVEAGKLVLASQPFSPRQVLADTAALFSESAVQKGLSLDTTWQDEGAALLMGDAVRLRQMLSNLTANAVKFTTNGAIRIEGSATPTGSGNVCTLRFAVTDTGPGLSPAQQALLFQPFSQLDSSDTRRHGGSGLGLSIVRRLAESMGGEVGVSSLEGCGATFWFRVPLPRAAREALPGLPIARMGNAGTPHFAAARVLVAEDNLTNFKVVQAMLGVLGVHPEHAPDGAELMRRIAAGERFDLILMDCQMPVLDGYAATRALREHEAAHGAPPCPVVALTASAFEEDRQHCLDAGMSDFLAKPIDIEHLAAVLAHWLPAATPAAAPAAVQASTFDPERFLRRLAGQDALARQALEAFQSSAPGLRNALARALDEGELATAQRHAQTLRGAAANISADPLATVAARLEQACRSAQAAEARALLPELDAALAALAEALDAWLACA